MQKSSRKCLETKYEHISKWSSIQESWLYPGYVGFNKIKSINVVNHIARLKYIIIKLSSQ